MVPSGRRKKAFSRNSINSRVPSGKGRRDTWGMVLNILNYYYYYII
jgi:hypothetical protein